MAQRRGGGLARSTEFLLGARLEAGGEWPRPAAAGDDPRDLRERAVALVAEEHALFGYQHLVGDALPLSEEPRARHDLSRGRSRGLPGREIGCDLVEPAPRRGLE